MNYNIKPKLFSREAIQSIRKIFYNLFIISLICSFQYVQAQTPVAKIINDTKPVSVKEWLVAGPFLSQDVDAQKKSDSKRLGFATDYLKTIGGENNAKISEGAIVKTKEGKEIKFIAYRWNEDYLDLSKVLGDKTNVCAYLYTELESDTEQSVVLHLGTNDAGKLWVNGKLVTFYAEDRAAEPSQNTALVKLVPGKPTSILLKIDQGGGGWGAYMEVYGKSDHKKFMRGKLPERIEVRAVDQFLSVGDKMNVYIEKSSNAWFELNVPVKWKLKNKDKSLLLEAHSDNISFVVPEGFDGETTLTGTKNVKGKEIIGKLEFVVRNKEENIIAEGNEPIAIGNRRELFIDDYLIHKFIDTRLVLHEPHYKGEVLAFDKPWEGEFCGYITIIKNDKKYQAFYRGMPIVAPDNSDVAVTCYSESEDGIIWNKPNLGIYEINGSKNNNVILANDAPFTHNFSPFLDTNPNCKNDEKYKAVAGDIETGLFGYKSKDGINWEKIGAEPIFEKGVFDSQNVVFWSESEQCYLCYFRTWTGNPFAGIRTISRTTSKDFINWTEPVRMEFGPTPLEELYTNQTSPYFRAPHIYIAIAARFMPERKVLTNEQAKKFNVSQKYFNDCSDVIFMTSRGGNKYNRMFMEGFIRPGVGLKNWVSRTNYPALNVVQTSPVEMSVYIQKDYAQQTAHLARYSLRLDGFASVKAPYLGGEVITKLLTFTGKQLALNFSTSAAGFIKVEILDEYGNIIPGFELENSIEIIGDEIERNVTWKGKPDLGKLEGKPVRLRFVMKDADLYSINFNK